MADVKWGRILRLSREMKFQDINSINSANIGDRRG